MRCVKIEALLSDLQGRWPILTISLIFLAVILIDYLPKLKSTTTTVCFSTSWVMLSLFLLQILACLAFDRGISLEGSNSYLGLLV